MTYSRLVACLAALAIASACSDRGGEAEQATADAATEPAMAAANDGGIPLSATADTALALYNESRTLADSGDFVDANQAARKLTEQHPEFAGGWIMLGNTALSGEQFVKATHKANELAANATDGERLWAEINMTFVTNDAAGGLRLGKQLVDAYPDAPRAWIVYSGLLTGQNRIDEARAAANSAIRLAPDQAITHNTLAFSYLYNDPKDFAQAETHFQHAIDIDPDEDNYHVNLGDVHRAMGDLEAARGDYSKALELDAGNAVAAVKRGHVNSFLGNYDQARADYDTSIEAGEEVAQSTLANYRAFVNLHAGDPAAAVAELEQELERIDTLDMPADQRVGARIFALINITDICFNNDMLDEAAAAMDRLTAALAESGVNSGDEDFARQQKATAAFWQGQLDAHRGDFEAATAKAEEFAALLANDDNPRKMERYHELHGLIAMQQGDYESAIEHYRQSNLSTSPGAGDVKNSYMLATALKETGQEEEAAKLFATIANWNFNSAWFAMLRDDAAAQG